MFDDFNKKTNELKKLFNKYPETTLNEMDKAIYNISNNGTEAEEKPKSWIKEIKPEVFGYIVSIILIILAGLLYSEIPIFFFGFIFFIAGYFVGLKVPKGGIIFLFSHGGTGLGMMISSIISKTNIKTIISDSILNPTLFYVGCITLVALAILIVLFYNLSDSLKKKTYLQYLPLFLIAALFYILGNLELLTKYL